MTTIDGGAAPLLPYRIDRLERFQEDTLAWRRQVDEDRQDLKYLREDMKTLAAAVDGLRKVILGFALSVAASAVVFALSILVAVGKI